MSVNRVPEENLYYYWPAEFSDEEDSKEEETSDKEEDSSETETETD